MVTSFITDVIFMASVMESCYLYSSFAQYSHSYCGIFITLRLRIEGVSGEVIPYHHLVIMHFVLLNIFSFSKLFPVNLIQYRLLLLVIKNLFGFFLYCGSCIYHAPSTAFVFFVLCTPTSRPGSS